jgi:hypothetical protein
MSERELSDLKLDRKECPKCGAIWINDTILLDWFVISWVMIVV